MNFFAESIRDHTKSRPNTFQEISFSIMQEIQNKVRIRRTAIRRKIRQKIQEQRWQHIEGQNMARNGLELAPEHYLLAYDHLAMIRNTHRPKHPQVTHKLNPEYEQEAFQIYQLMLKKQPIFKVVDCRRKMKTKGSSRNRTKESRDTQQVPKKENAEIENEEEGAIKVAEEYLAEMLEGPPPQVQVVQITRRQEQLSLPKIDKMAAEEPESLPDPPIEEDSNEPIEMDRIEENESKSEVSESRRRSSIPLNHNSFELEDLEPQEPRFE